MCKYGILVLLSAGSLAYGPLSAQMHQANITGVQHVSCNGGSNGQATVAITPNPASPCGSHAIAWSTGSNTPTISGLTTGIYFVQVTDNCSGLTVFDIVIITQPALLTSSIAVTDVPCKGESTGKLILTVSGGTPVINPSVYNYTWSFGSVTTKDLLNVPKGTYSVNITDANGCGTTNSATISEPLMALDESHVVSPVSCKFGNNGAIDLTVWGGVSPYNYDWDAGTFFSEDVSGLAAGVHSLTVTDANSCLLTKNIAVTEPNLLTSTVTGIHVRCKGNSDGSVDLSVAGGSTPYSFAWTGTSFTLGNVEDLSNVPADNYNVQITDTKGCLATNSFSVTEPPLLTANISAINVSCYGISDGSINLSPLGGSPPYSFAWTGPLGPLSFTTEDISGIPAGAYSVVISDTNNCTTSKQITVTQPPAPLSTSITHKNVSCFGGNDGSIDLFVTGGTPPYQYNWSSSDTSQDLNNLFAATYSVLIVDANNCTKNEGAIVTEPAAALSSSMTVTAVSCFGFSDGSIQAVVAGGTQPYSYKWVNSSFTLSVTGNVLSNFPADTYVLTITDANQCILKDTAIITQPTLLQTSITGIDILCFGDSTGSVDLTVSGGIPPYAYSWSNSALSEDISDLKAGIYSVIVTDSNSCIHADSIELTQPFQALESHYNVRDASCNGYNDASIAFYVLGGSPPYAYNWSNASTQPNLFDLTAGLYVSTVTDNHGCTLIDSIIVGEPAAIGIAEVVEDALCAGSSDGSIDIEVSGGTPSYRYFWTNSLFALSVSSQDLFNYPAEEYTVVVIDTNGCSDRKTIVISEPDSLAAEFEIADVRCFGAADGSILSNATGGTPTYTYAWSDGSSTADISNLAPGLYHLILTDSHGCQLEDSALINEPEELILSAIVEIVSCSQQSDGAIDILVEGGTPAYTYSWSGGETNEDLEDLKGGLYSLTVLDILDCEKKLEVTVPVDPSDCIGIPNSFTPNGDGKNDTWIIENSELYPGMSVLVFNIWGKYVYQSGEYSSPWNGTRDGSELPSATYFYIIDLHDGSAPLSGAVTIVK